MSALVQETKPSVVVAEITQADFRKLFVTPRRKGGFTLSTRVQLGDGPQVMTLAVLDAAGAAQLRDALGGDQALLDDLEICRRSSKLLARTAVDFSSGRGAVSKQLLATLGWGTVWAGFCLLCAWTALNFFLPSP